MAYIRPVLLFMLLLLSLPAMCQKEPSHRGEPIVEMRTHVGGYRSPGFYYPEEEEKVKEEPDSNRNWIHLLEKGELSLQDTTVEWPKFLKFCLGVYNWGDRFFNGFDTTYVVGTGRRWKVRLVNDLWTDSYIMKVGRKMPMSMLSHPIIHTGLYLQYMAVSIGYQLDMSNIIGNRPANNQRLTFGFACGLFNFEGSYTRSADGTYLRRFGDYNDGRMIREFFPGLQMSTFELDLYFYLNHRRYSQVAAYSFGRYQRKRAGSVMLGLSYVDQDIDMDFNTLPEAMMSMVPLEARQLRFNYRNYNILAGYGYSWPVKKHLLFNVTGLPAVGFNQSKERIYGTHHTLFSFGVRGLGSVTYNYNDLFAGLSAKVTGQYYYNKNNDLFSTIYNFVLTLGVRF